MAKITINDRQVECPDRTTIIRAARAAGVSIPHYCWHPKLPIAGNCRMCLVEVEGAPKLVTACTTDIRDGMVVKTETKQVKEAQKGVLEFLLLNHPLDCPICDKAGECMLQDQYFEFSAEDSRLGVEKVQKPKNLDIGENIVLDQERCVLCTRCVRFMELVAKDPVLGIVERGDHSKLTVFPSKRLDSRYSINTADICPVGALTSKKFRFRKRVWFLKHTESVCPNCSRGCPVTLDHENRKVYRMMPGVRDRELTWLCDPGRNGFGFAQEDSRPRGPAARGENGIFKPTTWEAALDGISQGIRAIQKKSGADSFAGILSTWCSNEQVYSFQQLVTQSFGSSTVGYSSTSVGMVDSGPEDDILVKADKNPNRKGVEELGKNLAKGYTHLGEIIQQIQAGKIRALWIVDPDLLGRISDEGERKMVEDALAKVELLVVQSPLDRRTTEMAHYVLPCATWTEEEGTFTNFEGRVQKFKTAFPPLGQSKTGLEIFSLASERTDVKLDHRAARFVFDEMKSRVDAWKELDYDGVDQDHSSVGAFTDRSTIDSSAQSTANAR